jgi:hypothetical protein
MLYNIVIEFEIAMKLVGLTKIYLNKTYSKICLGKNLLDAFPIQNGLKKGDHLLPLLFTFSLEFAIRKVWKIGKIRIE